MIKVIATLELIPDSSDLCFERKAFARVEICCLEDDY